MSVAEEYYEQVVKVIGKAISEELWGRARDLAECKEGDREETIRRDVDVCCWTRVKDYS